MRFCTECAHSALVAERLTCNSPENFVEVTDQARYLATGVVQPTTRVARGHSCIVLREQRPPGVVTCGPEGRWFVAKASA
jgi:hypothetical protein